MPMRPLCMRWSERTPQRPRRGYLPFLLCAVLLACTSATAEIDHARADTKATAGPVCILSDAGLDQTLARTRVQLTRGQALTIVAIGSSSTEGAGASSDAASYPSRLEALLSARFPAIPIRVLNRGIGGEEEAD